MNKNLVWILIGGAIVYLLVKANKSQIVLKHVINPPLNDLPVDPPLNDLPVDPPREYNKGGYLDSVTGKWIPGKNLVINPRTTEDKYKDGYATWDV